MAYISPSDNPHSDLADHRHRLRHSTAHVMAGAVLELFPEAKLAIGPSTEDGFYYDFLVSHPFTPEDLEAISERMGRAIAAALPFQRREMSRGEAQEQFADQPFKLEIIEEIPADEVISTYRHGDFEDLCGGPHVDSTGVIAAFKLLSVAGAYWRGDEGRPMLQRIYGTAFESKETLEEYLTNLEEAQRRDHRVLGRQLDLFSVYDAIGPGLVVWHPKGAVVRTLIEDLWRQEHYRRGYQLVYSPHIGRAQLWQTSGHLDFYRESMYAPIEVDQQEYFLKPMNCPFHIMIYQSNVRSYRDLPIRLGELGTVYRYERGGVLHGLLRVRAFTQDDAHIFCRPDQVEKEISSVLDFNFDLLRTFGFTEYEIYLATQPEKAVGDTEEWDLATQSLRRALEERGLKYNVDKGGGAFYGPKIDVKIKDALGRAWQCTTVQFDFNLPRRFDLGFRGADGAEHRPYMVHRALLGSLERFLGVLIEHYGGAFPVWLAPVQAAVIPIADRHLEYARQVEARLAAEGMRVEVDGRSERMNAKVRQAQLQKIPYMLIIGDREVAEGAVSVRLRAGENPGPMPLEQTVALIRAAIASKA